MGSVVVEVDANQVRLLESTITISSTGAEMERSLETTCAVEQVIQTSSLGRNFDDSWVRMNDHTPFFLTPVL
jgi:hypothetical protein